MGHVSTLQGGHQIDQSQINMYLQSGDKGKSGTLNGSNNKNNHVKIKLNPKGYETALSQPLLIPEGRMRDRRQACLI